MSVCHFCRSSKPCAVLRCTVGESPPLESEVDFESEADFESSCLRVDVEVDFEAEGECCDCEVEDLEVEAKLLDLEVLEASSSSSSSSQWQGRGCANSVDPQADLVRTRLPLRASFLSPLREEPSKPSMLVPWPAFFVAGVGGEATPGSLRTLRACEQPASLRVCNPDAAGDSICRLRRAIDGAGVCAGDDDDASVRAGGHRSPSSKAHAGASGAAGTIILRNGAAAPRRR